MRIAFGLKQNISNQSKDLLINLFIFILILLLSLMAFLDCVYAQDAENIETIENEQTKQVIILQSYHKGNDWTDRQADGIIKTFESSKVKVSMHFEYMDWKLYPKEENLKQLYQRLKYKYENAEIDLIITTDDAALKFALENRKAILNNAPVVFGGVLESDAKVLIKQYHNVTGVYQSSDPEGTIRIAKKFFPEFNKVFIIHDNSESGKSVGEVIKKAIETDSDRYKIYDLSNSIFDSILSKAKTLDERSIIFLASYNSDVNRTILSNKEFASKLSEVSTVPIFTVDEAVLGSGSIGGSLASGRRHGSDVAKLGLRILKGEDADLIRPYDGNCIYWGFDYNLIKKYNVSTMLIPQGSYIINKPFSFYETYKTFVISNLTIIIVLILFILYLLKDIKYRKSTEKKLEENQKKIYRLAYFNSITGLPNRISLKENVETLIGEDPERKRNFDMVYIDIDDFKQINDSFGHIVGDEILEIFSRKLRNNSELADNVYSLGEDEFIVIIKNSNEKNVKEIVERIFQSLVEPFYIDGNVFHISISGGIVNYPKHGDNFMELLRNADTAMYKSKENGKECYTFFDKVMSDEAIEKTNMQSKLREAVKNREFVLYYQPQLDSKSGQLWGFEALVRWQSPELGMVSPARFIKIAEESRLILPIGKWILEQACIFIKKINKTSNLDSIISVNISVVQIVQDSFLDDLVDILKKTGLEAQFLELEITESVFIGTSVDVIDKLHKIREMGVKVALDDFGTGYSSLSYLSRLPINTLKIDKSFVDSFLVSNKNRVLTNTIIDMGHALGMELVVEGVENDRQKELFTSLGCDRIQGYQIGRPVPEEEARKFLL